MKFSFNKFAITIAQKAGKAFAFYAALILIFLWSITGFIFHYSEGWQLFINTITSIVTFLMVFIIQHAQNVDTDAIKTKINHLVDHDGIKIPKSRVKDLLEFIDKQEFSVNSRGLWTSDNDEFEDHLYTTSELIDMFLRYG